MLRPADFRMAVRRGSRIGAPGAIVHVLRDAPEGSIRFGFVVNKAVGNAVTRNLVRRRLRSVGRDLLTSVPEGTDIVVRALPGCEQLPWATLHAGIANAISRGVSKG